MVAQYLIFTLDEQRYAVPLVNVDRVTPAVYITPLPKVPAIVLGIINIQGQVVPVINLRRRFSLPERELELSDQFIIAQTGKRLVALSVDTIVGIENCPDSLMTTKDDIVPGIDYIAGVINHPDGMLLIHNLAACLSLDEEQALEAALEAA